jgi:arsenate reductase (thioredoxin)
VIRLDAATASHVDSTVHDLAREFAGVFSEETIGRYVHEALRQFEGARIATYIPVLVHRYSRERLRALAQAEGALVKEVPEVLFVCVHNAGRSQMAAGLLNHHAEGRVHVRSAGSDPAEEINPNVVEAMPEVGIDVSHEFPKPLADELVRAADAVVTMGCGDACPVYPGKRYQDWTLEDPAGKDLATVRRIRDEIDARVRALLAELVLEPVAG